MACTAARAICWTPLWNPVHPGVGLEHLRLTASSADSLILAIDEDRGPFRLAYRLAWTEAWQLHSAELQATVGDTRASRQLRTDGRGHWRDERGQAITALDGCLDIDIWPTPFTNSFPIRRQPMAVGERRLFRMAWVFGPDLSLKAQPQAYTRLAERHYRFEALDGSGFTADLEVDADGIVCDYPGLFRRIAPTVDFA